MYCGISYEFKGKSFIEKLQASMSKAVLSMWYLLILNSNRDIQKEQIENKL